MYIFIFIVIAIVIASLKIVPQNHIGIVESFGKYKRTVGAGLNPIIPIIENMVAKVSLAVQNFFFDMEAVTKDKVRVHIKANLIFKIDIKNVAEFWYGLSNPKETLASFVENYSRSYVASQTHEELLEKREDMSDYLLEHLQERMLKWGIEIIGFQITDIIFPREITDAMSKVVASQRLKKAAYNEAEAQKIKLVKQAEAEKEASILMGEGVAGERQAIIDGLRESFKDMAEIHGLTSRDIMNLIMATQYFDTIKEIGAKENSKVLFVNPSPNGVQDIVTQINSALEASKTVKKE